MLWAATSLGGGALLGLLAQRMHPALSFRRLWLFYAFLMALFTGVVFAVAWL